MIGNPFVAAALQLTLAEAAWATATTSVGAEGFCAVVAAAVPGTTAWATRAPIAATAVAASSAPRRCPTNDHKRLYGPRGRKSGRADAMVSPSQGLTSETLLRPGDLGKDFPLRGTGGGIGGE